MLDPCSDMLGQLRRSWDAWLYSGQHCASPSGFRSRRAVTVALAFASASGCERLEPPRRDTRALVAPPESALTADKALPSEKVSPAERAIPRENASGPPSPNVVGGMTICNKRDLGPFRDGRVVDREIYSFPKINQQLAKYPELARSLGLDQIRSCADASNFALGYLKFRQAHPKFDAAEWPDKAEAFARRR